MIASGFHLIANCGYKKPITPIIQASPLTGGAMDDWYSNLPLYENAQTKADQRDSVSLIQG